MHLNKFANQQELELQNQKITKRRWSKQEDQLLKEAIKKNGNVWYKIAEQFLDRNGSQCAQRWKRIGQRVKKNNKWTQEEDKILLKAVNQYGEQWSKMIKFFDQRNSRQLRERYMNHLIQNINKNKWSEQEDLFIFNFVSENGTKWSTISEILVNRPENSIKNRYYGYLRKKYGNQPHPYYIFPHEKNKNKVDIKITDLLEESIIQNNQDQSQLQFEDSYSMINQQESSFIIFGKQNNLLKLLE